MDHIPGKEDRLEQLLYILGGCEVVIKQNQYGKLGAYPPLVNAVKKVQTKYLNKLERLTRGLPEEES